MKLRKKLMVWGAFLIVGITVTGCAEESYFDSIVTVEETSSDGMGLGDGSGDSSVGNVHVVKNSAGDALKGLLGGSSDKGNNTASESVGGSGDNSGTAGGSGGSFDSYTAPGSNSSSGFSGSNNSSGNGSSATRGGSSDSGVFIDGDIDAVYPEGYGEYEDGVFREDGEDGLIEDIEASSEAIPEVKNKDKKEDSDSTKTNEPTESEEKDKDKTVASVPEKEETESSGEKKEETTAPVKEETKETTSTEPAKEKEPEKENTPETKEVVKETPAPAPAPEPEPEIPAEPPQNVEEESKDINIRIFIMNECGARLGMICIIDPYTQEAIRVGALGNEEMFILDMKWPTKEKHFRIGCYDESGNLVKEDSIDFKHITKGCILTLTGNGSLSDIVSEIE
jgi:hypothetical protein